MTGARFLPLVLVAWAMPVAAQDAGSRPTREYVEAGVQSDTFEIREAEAVLTGSADPRVRGYAQAMLRDHSATIRARGEAATQARMTPPPMQIGGDQARMLGELQSLNGAELDRAYARHQALAHRAALTVEQGYAATGDQPALRRVATGAVPVIAQHLQAAERLKMAVGG